MGIDWLAASLVSDGRVIRTALNPAKLTTENLPDICLRMHLIFDSIEYTRCEGRLINLDIMELVDTLYSDLLHKATNHLDDWVDRIEQFGDYYELSGTDAIEVSPRAVREQSRMFEQLRIDIVGDELNEWGQPSCELPHKNFKRIDLGLVVFLTLGLVGLLTPYISMPFVGLYWAAIVAVAVFVLWCSVMPTTCMNGGLICSIVAMGIAFNTIGIVLGAALRFMVFLFS